MAPRTASPESHGGRVEKALYFRCRRGEPEALAALLYRLVDRLHTAASYVAPDEATATTAVMLAWEDTLALLTRLYVGGHLQTRALGMLGRRLGDYADRSTVRRALRNAWAEEEEALLPLPEELLQPLVELTHQYAPTIQMADRERRALRRRVGQSVAAAVVLLGVFAAWTRLGPLRAGPETQLACLQERIHRAELIEALRERVLELPDPQGADQWQARTLQQAALALEEIANAPGRDTLRYLAERVQREETAAQLGEMMAADDETARRDLVQTQLVLEEVQSL